MNLEIVAFYPGRVGYNKNIIGTLHVCLLDEKIDIRGFEVLFCDGEFKLFFPSRMIFSQKEQKTVRFPVVEIFDTHKKKEFLDKLYEIAIPFLHEELAQEEVQKILQMTKEFVKSIKHKKERKENVNVVGKARNESKYEKKERA